MKPLAAFASLALMVLFAGRIADGQAGAPSASHALVTADEYLRWQTDLTNWGRWGKDDELGALNLVTPAKRKQAAGLIKEGLTVSLASNAATARAVDVPCPAEWAMAGLSQGAASDRIAYPCIHGAGATHIDSLAHIFFNGKMWNGYSVDATMSRDGGASRNSVMSMKDGVVTRAVLFDIPRLKGVPYLEPGTRIYVEDLEAWERRAGVKIGSGDALLLRWGRWARGKALGPWNTDEGAAGLDNRVIPWIKQRDIALVGWETPGYAPQPAGDLPRLALHNFVLSHLGVMLIDRADFDDLAAVAAARNRWEFMLSVAPLRIPNGTGSPVNPIAIF